MEFSQLDEAILFEDDAIVVINKPAGWVVNRADSYKDKTIEDWTEERFDIGNYKFSDEDSIDGEYGSAKDIFLKRNGIVHRLDKDTSGVLLLAKTPSALVELLRQFRDREVEKKYVALTHGKLQPTEGIIRLPMQRSEGDYKKFAVSVDGKLSETHYKVIQYFSGLPKGISEKKGKGYQGFSLVELLPKTGRTHQIRVHLSTIKHPIVGDGTYAGRKRIAIDKEWCPRQFLHAKEVTFTHPIKKQSMTVVAPLAPDLEAVLSLCM
jgi:23S rRNA pseudouridine1911/1915/1917 synthase